MRNLRYALLPALLMGANAAIAQDVPEALNLSNLTVQGTARSMGFGNALGSVGGDFSAISVNPAGLGVYRSSEFTFTPSLRMNGASSQFQGKTTDDNNTHFNINNFGMVLTWAKKGQRYERANWKSVSFAVGMNRAADFNQTHSYSGKNTNSSGSQVFESDANQYPADAYATGPSGALGYMGYRSYLLNVNAAGQFYSIVPFQGGVNQQKTIQVNGGVNEYVISLGGNYKEKLMLGVTIGLPSFRYKSASMYTETLSPDNNAANPNSFTSFNYNQTLELSGNGVNAKLGAIYKINDEFRLGAAFHTPTYYTITDVYTPSISVYSDSGALLTVGDYDGNLQQNQFEYTMTSPWRGVLSATYIFKKLGFITADYEYVNYASARYQLPADGNGNSTLDIQNALNQGIKSAYKGASNFRIGAEGKIGKFFMLRAGFGYYGNPYKSGNDNAQRMDLSAGLGFRFKHFFTDLGFVRSMYELQETPYSVDYNVYGGYPSVISGNAAPAPVATTAFSVNNIALTVGVKL